MFEILDFAKGELLKYLPGEGAVLADFTLGGGHDTAYFAALPQVARVYSFDIQPQAIRRGRSLLQQMGYTRVRNIGGIAAYSGRVER